MVQRRETDFADWKRSLTQARPEDRPTMLRTVGVPQLRGARSPAGDITTIAKLCEAVAESCGGSDLDPHQVEQDVAEAVRRVRRAVPRADIDPHVFPALAHTLHHYRPGEGSFPKLLELTLRGRAREADQLRRRRPAATVWKKTGTRSSAKREWVRAVVKPHQIREEHLAVDFLHYSRLLLDAVQDKLQVYDVVAIQMKMDERTNKEIAARLSLSVATVATHYCPKALAARVGLTVRAKMLSLSEHDRARVVVYLLERTSLTYEAVGRMLHLNLDAEVKPAIRRRLPSDEALRRLLSC